jgi:hypothetical protein
MAYSTINKSDDYFNTKLYTGTGSSNAITGVGHQPDLLWIKKRNGDVNHLLHDSIRGVTKLLVSNATNAEDTNTNILTSFDSDGFTVGTNSASNGSSDTFVSWNWKAGTTSGLSGGTITPSYYSINTTSKFGIYTYTGNGVSGATISHGLGAVPTFIIVKRTDTGSSWTTLSNGAGQSGATAYGKLNSTDGYATASDRWNNTAPTTSVFSLGNSTNINENGGTYVAYVFCDVTGFFQAGLYQGNNNANGTTIYTGGKPKLILIRPNIAGKNWFMYDYKRNGVNSDTDASTNKVLWASSENSEANVGNYKIDILSNGFKIRETGTDTNGIGNSYQYWCWMQSLVGSNNVPCTAR